MDLFTKHIEDFKSNTLYRGMVALRSFEVDKWIKTDTTMRISAEGESGVLVLTPEELSHPIQTSKAIEDKFGKEDYYLYYYKWNPLADDRQSKLINLIGEDWYKKIGYIFDRPYVEKVQRFLTKRRQETRVHPKPKEVFRIFKLTPYKDVKIVILGQD